MDETTPLLLRNQSHALSKKRLLAVFPALALIQFTSFLDQTAISTSLPAIASALDTGASISLVGASFLITSTSIQLINGRLSDIFGRKAALVTALCIMGAGNLWSGFCTTPLQLFVSRACTGFGAGAINALVQIAIADITTLEQRGYYFGMVGMAVAFGNGLGPVVGGVLTQSFGWRWAFWFVCPLCLAAIAYLSSVWPSTPRYDAGRSNISSRLKLIDWPGAVGASPARAGTLLLPMVVAHGLTSALTGIIISATGRYKPVIVFGAFCWVSAALGKLFLNQTSEIWKVALVGVLDGLGVGCSLQPGSDTENRAVLTGLRNFVRDLGGATGTTVSGTTLSNLLFAQLQHRFSPEMIARLTSSAFALKDLGLTDSERRLISGAYMNSLKVIYVTFAPPLHRNIRQNEYLESDNCQRYTSVTMPPPKPTRFNSFWSPLMLLWPAITIHWATFKEAFRTRGFAALWNPTKQLEYGVASLLSETSEGFIEYESTTVVPSLVKQARGKILELGPGPGNQIHRFDPDLVESICAIDPNPNFNDDIALKLQASALESRYKFVVCGVEDSDILRAEGVTEGSLDTILSIQVMCAVNDPRAIMKEVWKLLKPGGQFIFWEHGKSRDTLTSIGQTLWNPAWSTFVGCNMNRDIRGAILAAGEWEGLENVEETDDPLTFLPRFWGVLVKKA
ncbi:efflux pump antibiotic resistance protein [Beauveria bassiana ARSEF 2860]|uniref:Efflux pump antibiotic resistance protein n=2 Tax=Beauveria bassiana TaxID=176275 RepID=J5JAL2_BEAB2|nr:efflux pump antibiotic resistance protein [Beauveria bassiana ARSEF 2860]EJP63208.1 efflux pump antibiotic resistance protein [Beauveria bassiana ARSEF 2860]